MIPVAHLTPIPLVARQKGFEPLTRGLEGRCSSPSELLALNGRGDWIRTSDPLRPRQVRYQAAPRPDTSDSIEPHTLTAMRLVRKPMVWQAPHLWAAQWISSAVCSMPSGIRCMRAQLPALRDFASAK